MTGKNSYWFLLSGLILGVALGFLTSWVLAPADYVDTVPSTLRIDYKDQYRLMIASAYASNGDLLRAYARLGLLDQDPVTALKEQSQRMLAASIPVNDVQPLANLTSALEAHPLPLPSATPVELPTQAATFTTTVTATTSPTKTRLADITATKLVASPTLTKAALTSVTTPASPTASPSPTEEPSVTPTPKPIATLPVRPTATITPTPSKPYKILKQSNFCEPTQPGLLQIVLVDSQGKPAAGIELVITWANGEEHFFTGLKPELGFGYADFRMSEQILYTLTIPNGSTSLTGLRSPKCNLPQNQGGKAYPGGIHLEFKQPEK
jgi:hypothetical protein